MPDNDATPIKDRPSATILGLGQMGLVCAGVLTSHAEVTMWGHTPEEVDTLAQTRCSARLPGFALPPEVRVSADEEEALRRADIIISAVPVQFMRSAWERLKPHVPAQAGVVSVSKGIENETLLRPTRIVADVLDDDPDGRPRPLAALSGPTIAAELARCLPATMIAASDEPAFAATIQELFSAKWLRIYTNNDVIGVELAGALKNVIAIAAGVIDGLQAGINAKSALLARGIAEITRLGVAMGASSQTFFGIAGVGDLATTCFSPEGRNRSFGEALGKGETTEAYLARTLHVVEGIATTQSVMDLATRYKVELPIVETVNAVLYEGLDPVEGVGRLMSRAPKQERIG